MMLIFNDISFSFPFKSQYDANEAIIHFAQLLHTLKDKKISKVNTFDIKVPSSISGNTELSNNYTLINAISALLKDINYRNLMSFLLTIMSKQIIEETDSQVPFLCMGKESKTCAEYKNNFFLSIIPSPDFRSNYLSGSIAGTNIDIKNISNIENISFFWKELGFREYERNEKHKIKEGIRKGVVVSIAPENDKKGQELLNDAIEFNRKLYSVDIEDQSKIYEFRNHHANKFHGFLNNELSDDIREKIIKLNEQKEFLLFTLLPRT